MSRLSHSAAAHEGVGSAPTLRARLAAYARRNALRFVEYPRAYELRWFDGQATCFIEIDKRTSAVRVGVDVGGGEPVRYHGSTYLGMSPLEDLLEKLRDVVVARR